MNECDWGYLVPKVISTDRDSDEGMKVRRRAIWSSVCGREPGEKLGSWRQTITRTAVEEHTASGNLKASEFEYFCNGGEET